jgi:hypothetical protein
LDKIPFSSPTNKIPSSSSLLDKPPSRVVPHATPRNNKRKAAARPGNELALCVLDKTVLIVFSDSGRLKGLCATTNEKRLQDQVMNWLFALLIKQC